MVTLEVCWIFSSKEGFLTEVNPRPAILEISGNFEK